MIEITTILMLLFSFIRFQSIYGAGLLGCKIVDLVCEDGELCFDDGVSGQCMSTSDPDSVRSDAPNLIQIEPLSPDGQALLRYLIETAKDAPDGAKFQCDLAYLRFSFRRHLIFSPSVCNVSRPDIIRGLINEEVSYLLQFKLAENDMIDMDGMPDIDYKEALPIQTRSIDQDSSDYYSNADYGIDDLPLQRIHHRRELESPNLDYQQQGQQQQEDYSYENEDDGKIKDDDYGPLLYDYVKRASRGVPMDFSTLNDAELDNFMRYVTDFSEKAQNRKPKVEPLPDGVSIGEIIDENQEPILGDPADEEKFLFKKDKEKLGILDQGTGNKEHRIQTRYPNQPTPQPRPNFDFKLNDESLRIIQGNRVYIRLSKNFTEDDASFLRSVASFLDDTIAKPNNLTFDNFRVHLNELSFDVLPKETDEFLTPDRILTAFNLKTNDNRANNFVDAGVVVAEQAYRLMKKAQASLPEPPPAYVVETGIGSGRNSLSIRRSTVDDDDNFALLTLVVCSLVICTLAVVLGMYLYRNRLGRRHSKTSMSFFGGGGAVSADFEGKASKDYQELCRQRMNGRPPPDERAAENLASAAGGAGIVGTLAQRLGSQSEPSPPAVQSTHSSTSSWSEEPVQTNMDITTGHTILSYMEKHLIDKDMLEQEWAALEKYEPDLVVAEAGAKNSEKNRYPDVIPYDHCRVVLLETCNQNSSDYINASFICDHDPRNPTYIATQGPMQGTIADFWQMVWEQGSVVIVNLTKLNENGEIKCVRYWPENGSEVYHCYEVHLVSEHIWCTDYLVRSFYLKNLKTQETRTVTQFHFLTWPENGLPASTKSLLDFRRKVNKSFRGRSCPIILHCSDGSGRTGTYCLLDMVLNRINKGVKEIDIAASLEHLRDQRMKLVKSVDQFEFVLTCVAEEVQAVLKALPQ